MLHDPKWRAGLRGELLDRSAIETILPAWHDLSTRCLEDNVYYGPKYARALLDTVDRGRRVQFATVWDGGRLVALLPTAAARLGRLRLPSVRQAWATPFTFSCMPLIDRDMAAQAAPLLLDTLAAHGRCEWILPTVNIEGPTVKAMIRAAEDKGITWDRWAPFQRAAITRKRGFDEHIEACVSSKRRRELARNRRRLEELGAVGHEVHGEGPGLDRAIDAFLDLEQSGWKGKRGTALACNEDTREFALAAFRGERADAICRADMLTLDSRPIAVSLMVIAGGTGFTVKCAFDEAYRNFSAGLLLEMEVIRSFHDGNWADRLDAATAGSHVIDKLWPDRIEVADLAFSFARLGPDLRLAALRRAFEAKRRWKARAKRTIADLKQALRPD